MSRRAAANAALLVVAVAVSATLGSVIVARTGGELAFTSLGLLTHAAFALVGAVIIARRPRHSMGWLFAVIGLLSTTGQFATDYAVYSYGARDGELALSLVAAWYAEWYWVPWLFLFLSGTLLLFPTGRPASRGWRRVATVVAIGAGVLTVLAATDRVIDVGETGKKIANPLGVSPLGDPDAEPLILMFLPLMAFSACSGLISLLLRFRRSRGEERQQLKWVTYGGAVLIVTFLAFGVLDGFGYDAPDFLEFLLMAVLPVCAGIAVLKHRLYDIDIVVNRTLVYGSLTAILAAAYLGLVALFQTALAPVTKGSDLAVVASTLAVAALFRPLRGRIQAFIDRRFYRRRYDAAQTLAAFSARLRSEVELPTLRDDLLAVVRDTLEPTHASLWVPAPVETRAGT